jgi:hypothetical protein
MYDGSLESYTAPTHLGLKLSFLGDSCGVSLTYRSTRTLQHTACEDHGTDNEVEGINGGHRAGAHRRANETNALQMKDGGPRLLQ